VFALVVWGRGASFGADAPAPWERRTDGAYQNRGVARIEQIGGRYLLTIDCHGKHSTYIEDDNRFELSRFVGAPIRARYSYVDEPNPEVRCFRAPCPPAVERRVVLEDIQTVSQPQERSTNQAGDCSD